MNIGIVIDSWKLPIFERHLKQGGYTYTQGAGITFDTINLYVTTEDVDALATVVRVAQREAERSRSH